MRMLTWDNIDFDAQTVSIEQSKRRAEVFLPISDDLFVMLIQQGKTLVFNLTLHQDLTQLEVNIDLIQYISCLYLAES